MKIKREPATVEDENENGESILRTKRTASRVGKIPSHRTEFQQPTLSYSLYKGSIESAIENYDGPRPLTIFTKYNDDSPECNEVKGQKFRKIFFQDEVDVLHPESRDRKYVKLTVFVASKDEECPNPRVYVEQRVYKDGRVVRVIQELVFRGCIQRDIEYVFKGCGDEDAKTGKRDLHVRFHSLEQNTFDNYMNHARYYGYDRNADIRIDKTALTNGVFYSFPGNPGAFSLRPSEIQSLVTAKKHDKSFSIKHGEVLKLLSLSFPGFGFPTEDGMQVGALNVRILFQL